MDLTDAAASRVVNIAIPGDQATHLDVTTFSDEKTATANMRSPKTEPSTQDSASVSYSVLDLS